MSKEIAINTLSDKLNSCLKQQDYSEFQNIWNVEYSILNEEKIQQVLSDLIESHYSDKDFDFYKLIFDHIVDTTNLNLNFPLQHYAPTFLSLSVYKLSVEMFKYFLAKGADVNYIGDVYAFEDQESIKREVEEHEFDRYSTCLDFAETVRDDMLSIDYNFSPPDWSNVDKHFELIDNDDMITVSKKEYVMLKYQAQYLDDLIILDSFVDLIRSKGGKTYDQLVSSHKNKDKIEDKEN